MKVEDIPQFTNPPNYQVHVPWGHIEETIQRYSDRDQKGMDGLELDPDFQRGHVWNDEKRIAFVEFCLRGGQSSRTLYFNHPNWQGSYIGQMVLVDGKQRLEAVRRFVRNELPIFGGNYLKDFDDPKRLLRTSGAHLIFAVNNLKTRKELLQWYIDLNDGGVVHTKEEIERVRKMMEEL